MGSAEILGIERRLTAEFPTFSSRHVAAALGNAIRTLEWASDRLRVDHVEDFARQSLRLRASFTH